MKDVAQMLSVWSKITGPRVYAHQTTWEIHMSLVGDQSASQIQSVQQHLHAGMKSVWILATVQSMPIVLQGTTEEFVHVTLAIQEIRMASSVQRVSLKVW